MTPKNETPREAWPFHRTWTTYDHVTFYAYSVFLVITGGIVGAVLGRMTR